MWITIAGYEVAGHPSMDGIGTFVIANKAAKVCAEYGVPVLAAGGVQMEKVWQQRWH